MKIYGHLGFLLLLTLLLIDFGKGLAQESELDQKVRSFLEKREGKLAGHECTGIRRTAVI